MKSASHATVTQDSVVSTKLSLIATRRVLGLLVTLVLLLILGRVAPVGAWLQAGSVHLQQTGHWGALVFVLAYTVGALLFVPAAMFTFVAGFALGPWRGVLVSVPGIATSSFAIFLLSRTLLRSNVERWLAGDPRLVVLDQLLARLGARAVVLLRLSPLSPFNVLNYAFGLTGIPKRHYFWATCVGTIPGSVFYAQLGAVAPHLGSVAEGKLPDGGTVHTVILLVGLLFTASVGTWLGIVARRTLANAQLPDNCPSGPDRPMKTAGDGSSRTS